MFKNQAELENFIIEQGRKRAQRSMDNAEASGRAGDNPYAKVFFSRFTKPLAEAIEKNLDKIDGKYGKSIKLILSSIEPDLIAVICLRTVISRVMMNELIYENAQKILHGINKNIMGEIILRSFKNASPEEYFYFKKALEARKSMDVEYRLNVAKRRMKLSEFYIINVEQEARLAMSVWLLDIMSKLGIIKSFNIGYKKRTTKCITLESDILDLLAECREFIEEASPYFLPCVEKPMDWNTTFDGGFYDDNLKKTMGQVIDAKYIIKNSQNIKPVLSGLNALQSVKWKINNRVLETAKKLQKLGIETDEIISLQERKKPSKPAFMEYKDKADYNDQELAAFKEWKKSCKLYYTEKSLDLGKSIRMNSLFASCDLFKDQPELYFVYFVDFRGRFYPVTTNLNPQGSDLQKAMLTFAEGKHIRTQAAKDWFYIHGANCYGVDKETYKDRIKWVNDNHHFIMQIAEDPISNRDWLNADKPFQFLSWCFEYKDFQEQGSAFKSHIAIAMDGSCNGLQHLSALLRDEVGGYATNLVNAPKPQDIYGIVAKEVEKILKEMTDDTGFRDKFLKHGINRKLVKRSVMTMPYGSTRFSAANFILEDYMKVYKPIEFDKNEYTAASTWLSHIVWKAIAKVVIKGRELMNYLQSCSGKILEKNNYIEWQTPNGLVVRQDYRNVEVKEMRLCIRSEVYNRTFKIGREVEKPNPSGHKNGISPNFIHSMDSAHMQRVINRSKELGINSLWMVHDDFGTHAADAEQFAKIIREEFVNMYEEKDWVQEFYDFHKSLGADLGEPPVKGQLDIRQVIDSPYFFG